MSKTNETVPGMAETEKLKTQAETGGERSMARPGASGAGGVQPGAGAPGTGMLSGGIGSAGLRGAAAEETGATSGMSGVETNESMPGGGATGDREQPDTVPTDR